MALRQCELNISQALLILENEENAIKEQFDSSVADLVGNGWDEFIARQALLAQWTLQVCYSSIN